MVLLIKDQLTYLFLQLVWRMLSYVISYLWPVSNCHNNTSRVHNAQPSICHNVHLVNNIFILDIKLNDSCSSKSENVSIVLSYSFQVAVCVWSLTKLSIPHFFFWFLVTFFFLTWIFFYSNFINHSSIKPWISITWNIGHFKIQYSL